MKISIITTVYQAEKDLPRLLDSMMAQKSPELEFFLIDNDSPDRCGEICREYAKRDSRFRVFTLKENIGYIRARNLGIQEVDGDYIGFCDSDDYLEPGGYDRAIEKIKQTECDLYITAYNTVTNGNAAVCKIPYPTGLYVDRQTVTEILPQTFGALPGRPALHGFAWKQIFRRSVFIENQLAYMPELQPYEDQVLNIDFVKNSKRIFIDDNILYNYIVNPESITVKLTAQFCPEEEWNRLVLFYSEKSKRATEQIHREALANQMLSFLYAFVLTISKMRVPSLTAVKSIGETILPSFSKEMLDKASPANGIQDDFFRWSLRGEHYGLLILVMRLMRKIRR